MRKLLLLLGLLAGAGCSGQCYDCCPPGSPTTQPFTVACRVVWPDGGPATNLAGRCSSSGREVLTDSTGSFSFPAVSRTCGIAAGSNDCGALAFTAPTDGGVADGGATDGGAAVEMRPVSLASSDGGSLGDLVSAANLASPGCTLVAR